MNFSTPEFVANRQRCRQWIPLITQQIRLRHLHQIIGMNLHSESAGSFYFTLHSTTMCAPFYTSEKICNPNPKWSELDLNNLPNTSASCIVLRIWQYSNTGADKIIVTWGIHFSGLVYIGNKIADIQPIYFKANSVIFGLQGGYYTSLQVIHTHLQKPIPFINNLNVINTTDNNAVYRRIAIKCHKNTIQNSYDIEKLKKIQSLQLQIKNKALEVENEQDKINTFRGLSSSKIDSSLETISLNSSTYTPQLLTMNSLNKMLQEKPTRIQKQEMIRISKEIELAKFKTRLLYHEKDRRTVTIRQLKQKYTALLEENEEIDSDLMENYRKLSRAAEKLKDYKDNIMPQHREMYSQLNFQLHQRRKQLLQELLFIYPIEKLNNEKYTIQGIYLPNSDILADSSDPGVSVALGYVTHILIMCSTFLQVPLRYSLTHVGSRSYVTDNISPLLPDRDREFPLFTRGKDKAQFTYAVYLLNKNIAQLRWLVSMNTSDLKATLFNLLTFLQGQKELSTKGLTSSVKNLSLNIAPTEKYVSLQSFGSISNISDPILDCIRQENQLKRSSSPAKNAGKKFISKTCRSSECGKGLSEILAIPEAYLNRQISTDLFRNYMVLDKHNIEHGDGSCNCTSLIPVKGSADNLIKITDGRELEKSCDFNSATIEQGTDPLDSQHYLSVKTQPINIHVDDQLMKNVKDIKQYRRISRSEGSYTEDETSTTLKTAFELGSEPVLNVLESDDSKSCMPLNKKAEEHQHGVLENWLDNTPSSSENLNGSDSTGISVQSHNTPLTARTNALLTTRSFHLVRPKL